VHSQQVIVEAANPHFPVFVKAFRQAFNDFDRWIPDEFRVIQEPSRPKFMHCQVLCYLEREFGTTGSPRLVNDNGLKYIVIEAEEFDLGVRTKKLSKQFRSYNHTSKRQDDLRRRGLFPNCMAYHIFLGYCVRSGLVPSLSNIAMTFEDADGCPVWTYLIWTDEGGINPIQEFQPNLIPDPPAPKVRPKKPKTGTDGQEKTG
jgi:hypothetical protein